MDERIVFFRVGVVVLATAFIAAILVAMFSPVNWLFGTGQYTVQIELPQAPGVMEGTPIRISGKTIGRVMDIEVGKDRRVQILADIDKGTDLYADDQVLVRSSLLGDSVLEIVGSGKIIEDRQPVEPDYHFTGKVAVDPMEMVSRVAETITNLEGDVKKSAVSVGQAGEDISKVAKRIDEMLESAKGDNRFDKLLTKTENALDNFNETMQAMHDILGDKQLQQDLRQGLSDLPQLIKNMDATMSEFRVAVKKADVNLENLKGFTGPLGERGPEMVEDLRSSVDKVDELLTQMVSFSEAINSREGTLGQMVHNPELYQNLNRAAYNIRQVSQRFEPIVEDVRIFTDKIARDPGRLGVRGVLRKESGVK